MSKKFKSPDQIYLKPDGRFHNRVVAKFINCMMMQGRKTASEQVFYGAMDQVTKKLKGEDPLKVFLSAIDNVKPIIEVRSRRVGGQNLQVPVEVSSRRQQSLAIRWLIEAMRSVKGKPSAERLANELVAAYKREGAAMTKRDNVHKMAEANKAFAHFAW